MNNLEHAIYIGLIDTRRFEPEDAEYIAGVASAEALAFLEKETSDAHGDCGYAFWYAKSED